MSRSRARDATRPVPVPERLRQPPGNHVSRSEWLYRLYLASLLGAIYGSMLVRALRLTQPPPLSPTGLLLLGTALWVTPVAAALAGVRFGRWAGPVPITRPEADLLLPTPVDRAGWLLPRLRRSLVAACTVGVALGLLVTVGLALTIPLAPGAWLVVPALAATSMAVGVGCAAVVQTLPSIGRKHRAATATSATAVALGILLPSWWPAPATALASAVTTQPTTTPPAVLLTLGVCLAMLAVGRGRQLVPLSHDEHLIERAGLHGALAASLRLADLRAVAQSREPTARRAGACDLRVPRRPGWAVLWRNLVALRVRPGSLLRGGLAWGLATGMVVTVPEGTGVAATILLLAIALGLVHLGTSPFLEPLRREHDSPLASEILPFGFAELAWRHLAAALLPTLLVAAIGSLTALVVTGTPRWWWASLTMVPLLAASALLVVADRVRHPANLGEAMSTAPAGMPAEVAGLVVVGIGLQPLVALVPVALPVAALLEVGPADVPGGVQLAIAVTFALVLTTLRGVGLWIWLEEFERSLADADLLPPTSGLLLTWRRLRRPRRGPP